MNKAVFISYVLSVILKVIDNESHRNPRTNLNNDSFLTKTRRHFGNIQIAREKLPN